MLRGSARSDLSLLDQGRVVGIDYGLHSMVELAHLGEFLLHSVYEAGSLRVEAGRAMFTLRNPPLRMGAFYAVRILWDGQGVPGTEASVASDGQALRSLAEIDRDHPLTIPIGTRTHFQLQPVRPDSHRHRVRLELQSVAIPPMVWFEFSDRLGRGAPA